jgi:hypothetical protein
MNKTIIVPKNKDALNALNYNEATDDQLYELLLNDHQFKLLWKTGIFNNINTIADSMIDIYEDENIVNKYFLNEIINSGILDNNYPDTELMEIMKEIKKMFAKAIEWDTGIFFFF